MKLKKDEIYSFRSHIILLKEVVSMNSILLEPIWECSYGCFSKCFSC